MLTTTVDDLRTGETLTYVHDEAGRLDRIVDPTGAVVDYAYDVDGNLVQLVDRRGATTGVRRARQRAHPHGSLR